jgi:RNA polymerase sigma-70 factor (ECF subfamily)
MCDSATDETSRPSANDEKLVDRFRKGDQQAFSEIYERYRINVHRFILSRIQDRSEAEDLTQETFIQAFRSIASFEGRSKLLTWLLGIARYACLRSHRYAQRWMIGSQAVRFERDIGTECRIESRVDAILTLDRCDSLLETFRSPKDRSIFRLHYGEGMPIRAIAAQVGKSADAVKTSLSRSRRAIECRMAPMKSVIATAA